MRTFPRGTHSAINRFMNQDRPAAIIYTLVGSLMDKAVDEANKSHHGFMNVGLVEADGKTQAYNRSIPVYQNQYEQYKKEGFEKLLDTKSNEKLVAVVEEAMPLSTSYQRMSVDNLQKKYLKTRSNAEVGLSL